MRKPYVAPNVADLGELVGMAGNSCHSGVHLTVCSPDGKS